MRRGDNPPNPFAKAVCQWLGPPPAAELAVHEEQARSIVTENDSPDVPYRWSVNPYRGCQHGCAYCYARRTHEYLDLGAGSDFETRIIVKTNAPELLATELRRPGWKREQLAFSGVTDCYQPVEARYGLTRQCLEVCRDLANPVGIVTKSALVVRDAELLAELHRRCRASVLFSITFSDDAAAARVEPGAPPPSHRFEAMRQLHEAGVPVGLMVVPVIPGLNDRDIPALLARAAECRVLKVSYAPIRLPGSVAEVFLARLRQVFPQAADRVEARIRDLRGGALNDPRFGCRMQASGAYWDSIRRLFETVATRLGLDAGQRWCHPPPDAPAQMKGSAGVRARCSRARGPRSPRRPGRGG
jgi:DNA repair photolyase